MLNTPIQVRTIPVKFLLSTWGKSTSDGNKCLLDSITRKSETYYFHFLA